MFYLLKEGYIVSIHSQIEESQREYYIREQIKALQNELGENEDGSDVNEIDEYTHRIDSLVLSEEVRDKLMGEVRKLSKMGMMSQEGVVLRNYLDTVLALPWNAVTKDRTDVKRQSRYLTRITMAWQRSRIEYLKILL